MRGRNPTVREKKAMAEMPDKLNPDEYLVEKVISDGKQGKILQVRHRTSKEQLEIPLGE